MIQKLSNSKVYQEENTTTRLKIHDEIISNIALQKIDSATLLIYNQDQ